MIVMMRPNGSRASVEAVEGRLRDAGLGVDVLEGESGTVLGAGGGASPELREALRGMDGVVDVLDGELGTTRTRDLRVESNRPLVPLSAGPAI